MRLLSRSSVGTVLAATMLFFGNLHTATAQLNKIFSFSNVRGSGYYPTGKLTVAPSPDGGIYGVTLYNPDGGGYGTIYRSTTSGGYATVGIFTASSGYAVYSGLTRGSDGNFYCVGQYGGQYGVGTILQFVPNANPTLPGTINRLYSFNSASGGPYNPFSSVLFNSGVLYGTTYYGGLKGNGSVWSYNIGSATFSVLYNFDSTIANAPYYPQSGLILSASGALVGTTQSGGTSGNGTIYSINTNGTSFQVLANMTSQTRSPIFELVRIGSNYYGTTYNGGYIDRGTVYKLDSSNTLTVLTSFDGNNGSYPMSPPTVGQDGSLYVVTSRAGAGGFGTLTQIVPATGASSVFNAFTGTTLIPYSQVGYYVSGLVQTPDKNFYIASYYGGVQTQPAYSYTGGGGSLSQIAFTTKALTQKYAFGVFGGYTSYVRPIQATNGSFYGVTTYGGAFGNGSIFRYNPANGSMTTLYSFNNASLPTGGYNGYQPVGGVIQASDGKLYGTTQYGGFSNGGTIFSINIDGTGFTVLRHLRGTDPTNIQAALFQGKDGALYGTSVGGGTNGNGTIFRITTTGALTVLQHLNGLTSGASATGYNPYSTLVQDSAGNLYGTCYYGGTGSAGTLFRLKPAAPTGYTVLKHFNTSDSIGYYPPRGLTLASDGKMYGVCQYVPSANGTIYRLDPTTGTVTLALTFPGGSGAAYQPQCVLAEGPMPTGGSTKLLYGTTYYGGVNNTGVVFSFNPVSNTFTKLLDFGTGSTSVAYPNDGVIVGSDRLLYGTTQAYGDFGSGTFFNGDGNLHAATDVSASITVTMVKVGTQWNIRVKNKSTKGIVGPLLVVPTSVTGGTITGVATGTVPSGYAALTGKPYFAANSGVIFSLAATATVDIPVTVTGTPTAITATTLTGRF